MAAKQSTVYRCTECDTISPTWSGRCLSCDSWGTLEKVEAISSPLAQTASKGLATEIISLASISEPKFSRIGTGLGEVERCLGGGIVPGSVILLGGDPGVGKSTLALQLAVNLAGKNHTVLYVSGEESPSQIKLRSNRLEFSPDDNLQFLSNTDLPTILAAALQRKPQLLIIDSVQTLYNPDASGIPGSVAQVSGAAAKLVQLAKSENITVVLIGHVTKEGYIAGPKTLEHIVDVVLYLEGERFDSLRLLRAVKNRFGAVNEVGVFEMTGAGLSEVANPSRLFVDEELASRAGTAYSAVLEGSRVLVCEIQALLSKSSLAYPKRTTIGFDANRLWLLLAVLSKYARLPLHQQDVYVNVVGGLKIEEPAVDLAVAAAMAGSYLEQPLNPNTAVLGELGLSGEVRPVSQVERRITELEKLGFERVVIPGRQKITRTKLEMVRVGDVRELLGKLFGKKSLEALRRTN